jgi:cytoskeletal protein RodZ
MKMFKSLVLAFVLFMGMASVATAQSANHTVNVAISAINDISIAGDVTLSITTATAGSDPAPVSQGTTYAVTTNDAGGTTKISASTSVAPNSLGDGPGNDLDLSVTASAPTGGTSAGAKSLGTTAVDVVTAMAPVSESGVALSYTLTATAETGQLSSAAIVVTYTITN